MIRRLVDFALENRFLVLAAALLLFVWGAVSFHQLPVEVYPDVADNYVEIITQWPGISAEQIEQQVTIPIEIVMNGIPHVVHLRSFSLFGLSDLKLIFDDKEANAWDRERVLERLSQVTLPPGVVPQMGTDSVSYTHLRQTQASRGRSNCRQWPLPLLGQFLCAGPILSAPPPSSRQPAKHRGSQSRASHTRLAQV